VQLLAQERSRVLDYAEILFAMHQHLFAPGMHPGLIAVASDARLAVDAGALDDVVVELVALLFCDEAGHIG
jgi:hypothetical protein